MDLPEGTVTFLFSDVEGSTQLLEVHPQATAAALARHHELFEDSIARHGGVIFETVGDAVYAAFRTATDAALAALSVQQALSREDWGEIRRLACRISLHTGEVERRGDHYFGATLFRCARLQALAYGEQTVVSGATADLIGRGLPAGAQLHDEGWHRLKDFEDLEHVFTLRHPELRDTFPPLKSIDPLRNHLPTQLSSFVGRATEVAELESLVAAHRLVTVTGPGGIGKTRLALKVAAQCLDDYPDGAYFVDLSAIEDSALVLPSILGALGLQESADQNALETLAHHLVPKRLLLVLDNLEQVVSVAASLSDLLSAAPSLHLLTTSRRPLRISGEQEFRVGSLATDGASADPDDASRLFIERARAAEPHLEFLPDDLAAVRQLCHALDGLPLAIELAAARVRLLRPSQLLARLQRRLPLLTGTQRDAPARHQTLANAIGWSYELLGPDDRRLFVQLGVFAGGMDLDAAAAVAQMDAFELLTRLDQLVDASLIFPIATSDTPRFGMLETIREFAVDRCMDEAPEAVERHGAYFAALLTSADRALRGTSQMDLLQVLDLERTNIRAALNALREASDARWLEMTANLWRYWRIRGALAEARPMLEAAIESAQGVLRGRLLLALGTIVMISGEDEEAVRDLGSAAGLLDTTETRSEQGEALVRRAMASLALGGRSEAEADIAAAIRIGEEIGDRWLIGFGRNVDGWAKREAGNPSGIDAFVESRDALLGVGDRITALHPRLNLIGALIDTGDLSSAERELAAAQLEAIATSERVALAAVAELQALLLQKQGRLDAARQRATELKALARDAGDAYYSRSADRILDEIRHETDR